MVSSPNAPSQDASRAERAARRSAAPVDVPDNVTLTPNPTYAGPELAPPPVAAPGRGGDDSPHQAAPAHAIPDAPSYQANTGSGQQAFTAEELATMFRAATQRPRIQLQRPPLTQFPTEPFRWELSALVRHVHRQREYFAETYPDLTLDECVRQCRWRDFIPLGADTLEGHIVAAGNLVPQGSQWVRYVNALIQVFIPGAWGKPIVTVLDAFQRLTVESKGLPAFIHEFTELSKLLHDLGRERSDVLRRDELITRLDPATQASIADYIAQLAREGREASFNDVCNRLLQFGPVTASASLIGAVAHHTEHESIYAIAGYPPRGPRPPNRKGPYNSYPNNTSYNSYNRRGHNNNNNNNNRTNYPHRLSSGARLCLTFARQGRCDNPACRYEHSPELLQQYVTQLKAELEAMTKGASQQRTVPHGSGQQHLQ